MKKLRKFRFPVPPLPVQQEIVRILDNFTELTAELTARKKQYEYYRDELLTIGNEVDWIYLEEIAEFKYGFTAKAKAEGNTRFVRITDIKENGKLDYDNPMYVDLNSSNGEYLLEYGDLLMARTGASFGKTMIFQEKSKAIFASFLIRIRFPKDVVNPIFYWHFSQSNLFWDQANKLVSKAGQPQFNANALKRVKMPIPPLFEQNSIVLTLDKFDALANDISIGLPAEIEARRKQYEYYRDKLLTFEEAK